MDAHAPESNKESTTITPYQQYGMARAQIEHENTLIGQRITWYLTFQGLLFTAFFVALGLFDPTKFKPGGIVRQHLAVGIFFLGFLGVSSSVAAYSLIRAAYAHIDAVRLWWDGLKHPKSLFPPLTGEGGFKIAGFQISPIQFLILICLVWIGLLAIF